MKSHDQLRFDFIIHNYKFIRNEIRWNDIISDDMETSKLKNVFIIFVTLYANIRALHTFTVSFIIINCFLFIILNKAILSS